MPKEDIIEGLRSALSKGETLDSAMMSFFNAGYPREEIEEAARFMQAPQIPSGVQQPQPSTQPTPTQPVQGQPTPVTSGNQGYQQINQISPSPMPAPAQKVSAYGTPKSSGKGITIALVLILLVLLGILVSVFLFREQLANFLNELL
ncbi:MAG: hypothetical protein Q8P81_04780 [Nanoarchaeota archaeon]|nr:hypothetical protein [Nanoarchaeota archaeon]